METPRRFSAVPLVGGNLALDFANTAAGTTDGQIEREHLRGYDDLVFWGDHAGLLGREESQELLELRSARPAEAAEVFARALELRGHLYRVFRTLAAGHDPPAESLETLRRFEREAISHATLSRGGSRFAWRWAVAEELEGILWPVVHSAIELLTSGPLDQVKGCAGCSWVFVDQSRNRSRRWCAMEDCGTAAKKRRYVARRAANRRGPRTRVTS